MAAGSATGQGIGQPVPRKEDVRLLTGLGQFAADVVPANTTHAMFARSPHAHARIRSIDTSAARAAPGVLAIFTGADLVTAGMRPIPHNPQWTGPPDVELTLRAGTTPYIAPHMPMPAEIVRFVGEAVAVVIADTVEAATDAAALIAIDYDPLPTLAHAPDALAAGAPQIWPECPGNVALDAEVGNPALTDAAFAAAAHVVRLNTWINRVTGSPMEPRSAIGDYDVATGVYHLRASSGGGVVKTQSQLAGLLGVPVARCRVYFGDMGGNFGTRNTFFPEYGVLPWAAERIGRPVRWVGDRQECFLSDYQGRDLVVEAELALDAKGNFLAVRGSNISNIGAYSAHFTPLRKGLTLMSGNYRIPAIHFRGRAALTNTPPTTPYRSAGRPEATFVIERLIDLAADLHGFDPVELRRRNLVPPDAMPYTNGVGITYDNGEYVAGMNRALELADCSGFPARRDAARKRDRYRGIGIGNYIEVTGGQPRERAEITIDPTGGVELVLGTTNSGQGHETSMAQLIVSWLGMPLDSIEFVAHDTARVSAGGGSHSGRSMRIASLAISDACDRLIEKGKRIAAHVFECTVERVAFSNSIFTSLDNGNLMSMVEVAQAAATRNSLPEDLRGMLAGIGDVVVRGGGFPAGTHICEVEVDADTGEVEIVAWSGVDDVGLAVNPLILHGQTHGAIAQGVGQALLEQCHYDRASAQLLSASYMDYAMPRAATFPTFNCELIEVPATSHKFGIRPGGEGGTTPALAAVINAIVDALSDLGVRHIEMPATSERVWRAIRAARSNPAS